MIVFNRWLTVYHNDGRLQTISITCGTSKHARRLPNPIGKALMQGTARAWLDYDGLERTAVRVNGRYYTRIKKV